MRSAFERWLTRRVRRPAPVLADRERADAVRKGLALHFETSLERFDAFFLRGRPLRVRRSEVPLFRSLGACGLAKHGFAGVWLPCARLVSLDGLFVASDLPTHREADQVFSPMFEQVYFTRHVDVRPDDDVLELGAGSGVLSLHAAATARRVTAVELHERALAFARFNLALNPVPAAVEFRQGSLYEPLEPDRRFDLILTNPPFEPVPPGARLHHHSDAGEDGLDVVRAILADVGRHLRPTGRFAVITWSPGTEQRADVVDLLAAAFPTHRVEVHVLEVWPLEHHLAQFERHPDHAAWGARLDARGLTHLHFVYAYVLPAPTPSLVVSTPQDDVAASHAIADDWL